MSLLGFDAPGRMALGQVTTIVAISTTSLSASVATYSVIGNAANLSRDFAAWLPGPFDLDDWVITLAQGEAWAPQAQQAETWSLQAKQTESWTPTVKEIETWTTE